MSSQSLSCCQIIVSKHATATDIDRVDTDFFLANLPHESGEGVAKYCRDVNATQRYMVLDSSAQFLAVAEHWLIPARARRLPVKISFLMVMLGSLLSACTVCLQVLPLWLLLSLEIFFYKKLGSAMRVTIHTGIGCVVHLFVVYGCQGAEEDSEKLSLTGKLLHGAS